MVVSFQQQTVVSTRNNGQEEELFVIATDGSLVFRSYFKLDRKATLHTTVGILTMLQEAGILDTQAAGQVIHDLDLAIAAEVYLSTWKPIPDDFPFFAERELPVNGEPVLHLTPDLNQSESNAV